MAKYSVATSSTGLRLDHWLAQTIPGPSRSRWQALIRAGNVLVDGETAKPSYELRGKELIEYEIPPAEPVNIIAEEIPLDIVYEDGDIIAINKQPGLVVHPAPGHATGTLVHALLHHCQDLQGVGGRLRPGIVHRLDLGTSGALAVARTQRAYDSLVAQLAERTVGRRYLALVWGRPEAPTGVVDAPIGRSTRDRTRMAVVGSGRPARTHYELEETRDAPVTSLLRCHLETGRTHQIRVHLSAIGHPLVGDRAYGGDREGLPDGVVLDRPFLHAAHLSFEHPASRDQLAFEAPLPVDLRDLLKRLGPTVAVGWTEPRE